MLSSIALTLQADDPDLVIQGSSGDWLGKLIGQWIGQPYPKHDPLRTPYTVSPVLPIRKCKAETSDRFYRARVTTLTAEVLAVLLPALHDAYFTETRLSMGNTDLIIADVTLSNPRLHACAASYSELLRTPICLNYEFAFNSPTVFFDGRSGVLLPTARALYRDYSAKWNMFAPESLIINEPILNVIEQSVMFNRRRFRQHLISYGSFSMVSFTGRCSVQLDIKNVSEEALMTFSALSRYSFYAGTGIGAIKGMGQTIPIALNNI